MNILTIEDNSDNFYLEQYLLQAHGHRVTGTTDGASGIALAQTLAFDVILLDIQLPDMDGHEVARRLLSIPDRRCIPIIAVTSFAMEGDRQKALAAGCSGYIEKPIDPETFVAQVERIVREKSSGSCAE
ncbi:MAG: response regulator [Gammaproteobacteria bacterium]|nr:response regulator [Gammaproteobacteria bacterium]MCB1871994.1 response regulator [Gammaproteobacteria bacterium]